jgi:hypothetical protein
VLGWAVALVTLEVGGVVRAVNVVSGLNGCQLIAMRSLSFANVTYTTPSLWKMIHGGEFVWFDSEFVAVEMLSR